MKIAVITPVRHLNEVEQNLNQIGSVFYLENGKKHEVRKLLIDENIDVIVCNPNKQDFIIDRDLLEDTSVRIVNTCSTGLNHIDVAYCDENGILIQSLTKDYDLINDLPSTAELAFGLLMSVVRKIPSSHIDVFQNKSWDYTNYIGRQIQGLTIGIVGYGRLGKFMEKYCKAFNAEVLIYDPYKPSISLGSLKELFSKCDIVSLHVHVSKETRHMINMDLFPCRVKFLINTSRGEIVDEQDIAELLQSGNLHGYGTDVLENEFETPVASPLLLLDPSRYNVVITPHTGGMTIEGQTRAFNYSINKLK